MNGLRIRQERIKRGWTLREVGEQVGLQKGTVCTLENGISKPSYDVLIKLENLFGLSHRELFAEASGAGAEKGN
jgi:transcriptional regulator with XRE-family HTH domain